MIKNAAYFPSQCAKNATPVIAAVLDALQSAGIKTAANSWDCDAAIIWSVLWNGKMQPNQQVYDHYRKQNKPVIVVEVGALHRGITWKVAVNNVSAQGYYGHLENLDWGRPARLNISLTTPTQSTPEIIIAAQHNHSLQTAGIDISEWVRDTVRILKNNTDRPIVVRPHPRSRLDLTQLPAGITVSTPQKIANTYDSFDLNYNCHAMVNYNSGPGIQAAIAGVRPVVELTSLAYPVGVGFADIEQPYLKDRRAWLTQICHTEYTLDELRQGMWLNRIAPALG
jgi:hypothetical protein